MSAVTERRQMVAQLRQLGQTQRAIAERLGVPQSTIANDCRHLPELLSESDAIVADARARLVELHRVKRFLYPDRDDPFVLSELTSVMSQIRAAESVLKGESRDV